ncbi:hypothetical protein ACGF5O_21735 [Streptomyces sp. NPDC048291]|uniref:hypothetical protein n=1 Tax=Streptomyces sp. NPDC048291 TaxID=3365530 RepID=UPI00371651F9
MSPTKPTATDDEATKKQRVSPADFDEFVTTTVAALGDGWTVNADDKPHPDLSAYLIHLDGRRIGIKHIWRGAAVQTWALDVPPREFDNDGDAETYADSLKHLTPGVRYNVGVCFTNNPPAATTARNIRTRLLPAFDGERPPLRAFPKKRPRRAPGTGKHKEAANTTTSSDPTRAADKPESATAATAAAKARRTTKRAQPTEQETGLRKKPIPRTRRSGGAAAKTTKAKDAPEKKPQPPEATADE